MEQDMALVITIRVISEVVVLDLFGRLWILDLPLRDKMNGFLNDGNRRFVVNLAGVEYIDSSGLGQLVSIQADRKIRPSVDGHTFGTDPGVGPLQIALPNT